MRAIGKINNVNDVEFAITFTAPLHEWTELRRQLPEKWPASAVVRQIIEITCAAHKAFDATSEVEGQ